MLRSDVWSSPAISGMCPAIQCRGVLNFPILTAIGQYQCAEPAQVMPTEKPEDAKNGAGADETDEGSFDPS